MSYIFDAAVNGLLGLSGKAYFFRNNRYVRYDWGMNQIDSGYPASVDLWHLPGVFATGVRAAVNGEAQFRNKTYFFRGAEYVEYDWATDQVSGPSPLSNWHFPASFDGGVSTAINGPPGSGKAYFFRGSEYVGYDWALNKVDPGFPAPISEWGLPRFFATGLHAALTGVGQFQSKAYFFRGPKYVSFDWFSREISLPSHLVAWQLTAQI